MEFNRLSGIDDDDNINDDDCMKWRCLNCLYSLSFRMGFLSTLSHSRPWTCYHFTKTLHFEFSQFSDFGLANSHHLNKFNLWKFLIWHQFLIESVISYLYDHWKFQGFPIWWIFPSMLAISPHLNDFKFTCIWISDHYLMGCVISCFYENWKLHMWGLAQDCSHPSFYNSFSLIILRSHLLELSLIHLL